MKNTHLCVDAGLVIRLVAFPGNVAVQRAWDEWDAEHRQVIAPTLLYYEVTNVLHRYQRQGWLNPEATQASLLAALALPIELVGDADLHLRARRLAERYHLPAVYDAHYVAVAERLGVELWSTDRRLVNALRVYHLGWVKLVE